MNWLPLFFFSIICQSLLITVHCQNERKFNEHGLYVPRIEANLRTEVPPHEPGTQISVDVPIVQIPMFHLLDPIKAIPILTYIDQKLPVQEIYSFHLSKFEMKNQKYQDTYHLLQIDPSSDKKLYSESAYFCPQGKYIDIPVHPAAGQPKYLFTPPFSGCHMVVDRIDGEHFRVYHVQGGHEDVEYNNFPKEVHGYGMVGAMEYKDYGYSQRTPILPEISENMLGAAYMAYSVQSKKWIIHYQSQFATGIPFIQSTTWKNENGKNVCTRVQAIISDKFEVRKTRAVFLSNFLSNFREDSDLPAVFSIARSNKKAFVDEANKEKDIRKSQSNSEKFNCV